MKNVLDLDGITVAAYEGATVSLITAAILAPVTALDLSLVGAAVEFNYPGATLDTEPMVSNGFMYFDFIAEH